MQKCSISTVYLGTVPGVLECGRSRSCTWNEPLPEYKMNLAPFSTITGKFASILVVTRVFIQ